MVPAAVPPRTSDLARQLKRLETCLDEVRYRETAAKWAREALNILERMAVARTFSKDDHREMMARCHVMLGKEAFLVAERDFWKRSRPQDAPDLSCRHETESFYFGPAHQAMGARPRAEPKKTGRTARTIKGSGNYQPALFHFERANDLFPDPWHSKTPRNLRLAGELQCDPCLPSFYLGVIALRQGDLAEARAQFEHVRKVPAIRAGQDGAMERRQLHVAAAVFEAAAAILEGNLAEASTALKRARNFDRQNINVLKNQGYLCERQGKPEQAISWYREALEWDPTDGYALRRRAAAEAQAGRTPAPVIKLRKPSDFHATFAQIASALRGIHGCKTAPRPVPEAALSQLRIAKRRVNRDAQPGVELPESVKTILRFDRGFALWDDDIPLLRSIVGALGTRSAAKHMIPSADIDRLVRTEYVPRDMEALSKLPKSVPVWNDDPDLPACIPLHENPHGEQLLFLYVGEADASGEYPIARYEDQPELWIAEASLIHLVVSEAINAGVRIECSFKFEPMLKQAEKRNAIYDERLSNHPRVQTVWDSL